MSAYFAPIPNFNKASYSPRCPVTGSHFVHDRFATFTDEFVLRGPMIRDQIYNSDGTVNREVELGFFDVRAEAIIAAAEKHLGMLSPENAQALVAKADEAEDLLAGSFAEVQSLQAQLTAANDLAYEYQCELALICEEEGVEFEEEGADPTYSDSGVPVAPTAGA